MPTPSDPRVKVRHIDFWPSFWPQDRPWADRFPGQWAMPVSKSTPCLICREPGYVVPAPPELPTIADFDDDETPSTRGWGRIETENTCPGHEYAVRKFLARQYAPRFAARVDAEATEIWRLGRSHADPE